MQYNKWNIDALKEDTDCRLLAQYMGIPIVQKGQSCFCSCFIHKEKTASMQLNKTFAYCHGCHTTLNAIDMVMNYNNATFTDACSEVAQFLGPVENYCNTSILDKNEIFPLKKEELSAIGLSPIMQSRLVKDIEFEVPINDDEYDYQNYTMDLGSYGIKTLFIEDEEAFWSLIYKKTMESKESIQNSIGSLSEIDEDWAQSLLNERKKQYVLINTIKTKFFSSNMGIHLHGYI